MPRKPLSPKDAGLQAAIEGAETARDDALAALKARYEEDVAETHEDYRIALVMALETYKES